MDVTIWPLVVFAGFSTFVVIMVAVERHRQRKSDVADLEGGPD